MKSAPCLLAVCCLTVILAGSAFAQADSAQVIGAIRDAQGGSIADAVITLRNVDTGFSRRATTDTDGRYRVTALPPGRYSLTADKNGFRTVVREGLILLLGAEPVIDVELPIGGLSESLVVTGDVPIVETTTSAIEIFTSGHRSRLHGTAPFGGRSKPSGPPNPGRSARATPVRAPGPQTDASSDAHSPSLPGRVAISRRGAVDAGTAAARATFFFRGVASALTAFFATRFAARALTDALVLAGCLALGRGSRPTEARHASQRSWPFRRVQPSSLS